ncbi:hypothetical protein ES703_99293 [subsurface metagenome]
MMPSIQLQKLKYTGMEEWGEPAGLDVWFMFQSKVRIWMLKLK